MTSVRLDPFVVDIYHHGKPYTPRQVVELISQEIQQLPGLHLNTDDLNTLKTNARTELETVVADYGLSMECIINSSSEAGKKIAEIAFRYDNQFCNMIIDSSMGLNFRI